MDVLYGLPIAVMWLVCGCIGLMLATLPRMPHELDFSSSFERECSLILIFGGPISALAAIIIRGVDLLFLAFERALRLVIRLRRRKPDDPIPRAWLR